MTIGRRFARHGAAAAILLTLALAAPPLRAANTLSGEQIRDLMTGTTIAFTNQNGGRVRFVFAAGGKVTALLPGGAGRRDEGTWSVERNRVLCFQFAHVRQGKKGCMALARSGDVVLRYNPKTGEPANGPEWKIVAAGPRAGKVGAARGPQPDKRGTDRRDGEEPEIAKQYIRGAALRALVSGTTVSHVSPRSGSAIRMSWNRDGTVVAGSARNSYNGTWTIEHDRAFCLDLPVYRRGKTCMYLIQRGDRIERYTRRHTRMKGEDWVVVSPGSR